MAPCAEKRNVCLVGISICLAIHYCPFQNSGFLLGSSGLAEAHHYPPALRLEFSQRKARLVTFPVSGMWPRFRLLSSEKDAEVVIGQ